MIKRYKRGEINADQYWSWAAKQWHANLNASQFIDLLEQGYELDRESEGLCDKLREKGYKTVVCSNNYPERIAMLDRKFDFLRHFDVVVLSYEQGMLKPDLLRRTLKITKLKPGELVLIDDTRATVDALKEQGYAAVLFENHKQLKGELARLGIKRP